MIKLSVNIDNKISSKIPSKDDIKEIISKVLVEKNLDGDFEVDIRIVDKNAIRKLNQKYRNIDKPTDVLSFPIQEKIDADIKAPILLGDIVICPEMAEDNIIDLIKHSTLHLLGFHHPND